MSPTRTVIGFIGALLLIGPGIVCGQTESFLGKSAEEWVRQLKVTDAGTRRGCAFALGRLGAGAEIYLPRLLDRAVNDDHPGVRETAAMAVADVLLDIRKGGEAVGPEIDPQLVRAHLLARMGLHWKESGPALLRRLGQEKDAGARRGLICALGAFGPVARPAIEPLRTALKDPSPAVRRNAAWALGRIGPAGGEAVVSDLCELLGDPEPLVRRDAATALGDLALDAVTFLGPEQGLKLTAGAGKQLLDLIDREGKKTGDSAVFKNGLESLVKVISKRDEGLAERIYPYLEWDDPEIVWLAAFALGNMGGPQARPALKVLREGLKNQDPQVQEHAAEALGQMKEEAVPAVLELAEALDAPNPGLRQKAAVALGEIGPAAEPAVPKLALALQGQREKDEQVRRYAAFALLKMESPANDKAIPTVIEVIRKVEPTSELRKLCIAVLFHVQDIKKHQAETTLLDVLRETDPGTSIHRYTAAQVLASQLNEGAPRKVGEVLLEMLTDTKLVLDKGPESRVGDTGENQGKSGVRENRGGDARFLAAQALGWMGRAANKPEIIAALKQAAQQESNQELKQFATQALDRVQNGFQRGNR